MPAGVHGNQVKGSAHYNWNGGRTINDSGYVMILKPDHPRANSKGYVSEHLAIGDRVIGRILPDGVQVHHFNEIRSDNANKNLVICENQAYHLLLHQRARAYRATGCATARSCVICKGWNQEDLYISPSGNMARHRVCHAMKVKSRARALGRSSIIGRPRVNR